MSGWFTEQVDVAITPVHHTDLAIVEKQRQRNGIKKSNCNILIVEDERDGNFGAINVSKTDAVRIPSGTDADCDTLEVSEIAFGYVCDYLLRNGHNDVLDLLKRSIKTEGQLAKVYRQCVAKKSNGFEYGATTKGFAGSWSRIQELLEAQIVAMTSSSTCDTVGTKKKRRSGRPRTTRMAVVKADKGGEILISTENGIESLDSQNATDIERETNALASFNISSSRRSVRFEEPGRISTKEYIFFRDTPPMFVTETLEEAIQITEKLRDELLTLPEPSQDRYIELQSNDVSKYNVGQMIQNLGPDQNVTGIITKLYGTRQCGTSGPGTIIIDTCSQGPVISRL
uniref:Uncharacterized protein AlNc14C183G8274 n=1 Tax=Albugo laibachii Nc14 TaxID=890382 RepID=F0W1U1_9STRA|nr:conserved hypothetical protein [Albugo laibachii Nc14]CCA23175.1 conserved hypothetical protein [Albugo laibachii Nc14]|eukprot:CCA23175.1 conserved hypothetical protein [Albugo laibachii Nc14]